MKKTMITCLAVLVFALLSVVVFLSGVVPFRPIPPSAIGVFWKIITCFAWSMVGIYLCRRIGNRHAIWLLLFPFVVMVLHCAGGCCLVSEPIKTILLEDTKLYAVMAFLSAIIVQICMIREIRKNW